MVNNFSANSPINLFQGDASFVPNTFEYNVAIDSRDINSIDVRGFGFWLNGSAGSTIQHNVAAHQHSGTGNVVAFNLDGVSQGVVFDNAVYDWTYNGHGWGKAFDWDSGTTVASFQRNKAYMPTGGMCLSNAGPALYSSNHYWTINPIEGYPQFSWSGGSFGTGDVFGNPGPIDVSVASYMATLGVPGSLPEFVANARLQSKASWNMNYTADAINDFVRSRLGIIPN
jgi:hypothetical protein